MSDDTAVQLAETKVQTQEVIKKEEKPKQEVVLKGKDINVQDVFLSKAKEERQPIVIYMGKITMTGLVKDFDQFTITVESYGNDQMLFKQAITYIEKKKPKKVFKPREGFRPRAEGEQAQRQYNSRQSTEQRLYTPRTNKEYDRTQSKENNTRQDRSSYSSQEQRPPSYRSREQQENNYQDSRQYNQKLTPRNETETRSYNQRPPYNQGQQNQTEQRPPHGQVPRETTPIQTQPATENKVEDTKRKVFKVQKPANKKD